MEVKTSHFFACLDRLRLIQRWSLMRNIEKENLAELVLEQPSSMAPIIVAAERDVPGTMARHWKNPMKRAVLRPISFRVSYLKSLSLLFFSMTIIIIP